MDNLKRYITNEAKRIFDEEEEKMHIKDKEDRNKVSQWKNKKLNKYLSF